jgi:hypothetical protein
MNEAGDICKIARTCVLDRNILAVSSFVGRLCPLGLLVDTFRRLRRRMRTLRAKRAAPDFFGRVVSGGPRLELAGEREAREN